MRTEVRINFQFNMNSSIDLQSQTLPAEANVSNGALIFDSQNANFRGFKGFHFAGVKDQWPALADGSYNYYDDIGYRGYCSRALSSSSGSVNVAIAFFITGAIPNDLYITFDRICNEYATSLIVRNNQNSNTVTVNNNSVFCTIPLTTLNMTQSDNLILTVTVTAWSKPFKNVKIAQMSFNYVGVYTESELKDLVCSESLFDKNLKIQAGICEQYADFSIYDRSQIIHNFAMKEILVSEQSVAIDAVDDQSGITYSLGTYVVDNWDVSSNSSTIKVSCKDITLTFENIFIEMIEIKTRSVDDLLKMVFAQVKNISWRYIDVATETYCKSIITPNSWFYTDTLLKTLIKISLLGMIRIYWADTQFVIARCY